MSKKDIEEKLLNLLEYMIKDHERHFDKDTARHILSRVSIETLLNPVRIHTIKNFSVSSNIFGHILLKNTYGIAKDDYSIINDWKEILAEKNPILTQNPDIIFVPYKEQGVKLKDNLTVKSNFITYYAIHNFKEWVATPDKEILGYTVDDVNTNLLTFEAISVDQNSYYSVGPITDGISSTSKHSEDFLKLIIKGKEELIKQKWFDDKSFTNKLFASKRMKAIMKDVDGEVLTPLFSEQSLGTIIKQANNFATIAENRDLFINLSPLAPAEKWLDGFRKLGQKKHIDLIDLFNNKFNYGYGINLPLEYKSGFRKEGASHPKLATVFKEELKFLFPALSKMTLDKNQLCLLVNGILRTRDVELMSIFLDSFDIPKVNADESVESNKIYNKMIFNMDDKINLDYVQNGEQIKIDNWYQAIAIIQANKLEKELTVNNEPVVKRKLKI